MKKTLLAELQNGDNIVLSSLISAVENGVGNEIHAQLYPYSHEAIRIGITGPPGAGKSTLIDKLIGIIRSEQKSVGVISVDPTSPFSGGAILGDRVRMNQHTLDQDVFIRSMGSRGEMGGVARMTHQVADIIASSGKDIILIETIGVGQAEAEIIQNVDMTVVVLVPESGDDIQFMKAGPIEYGDLFVVNKADREGARRVAALLKDYISDVNKEYSFRPEIIMTVATEGHGIKELYKQCRNFIENLSTGGELQVRRRKQYFSRVRNNIRDELERRFWSKNMTDNLDQMISTEEQLTLSPSAAALRLIPLEYESSQS
ncbi:MAG: methylmalonyl Co-A mutase-associated GTPase MeaB [Fidelibacterota bacterium]